MKFNSKYEILTKDGFKDFKGLKTSSKDKFLLITFDNGNKIKCSYDHPFIKNEKSINANKLVINSTIDGIDGIENIRILNVEEYEDSIEMFDIVEVDGNNTYIVEGVNSHNCDFVSSGHNVIESSIIEKIKETTLQEPLQRIGIDNCTWIWKHPVAGKDYLITADVSRGDGSDYSSCHILDLETMEQVGEYKGLMDTNEYGRWLTILGEMYNKALIVLENNGVGWATVQSIIDRGYSNLYWSYKSIDFVDVDVLMMKNYDTEDRTKMIPGITTNSRNRPLMIEKLQQYFREESLVIHSRRMISELETFIWNNNKAQAQSGFNDDLIMSLAIGCWVRDTALRLRKESMDSYKNNLKYYGKAVYTNNNHREDAYSMKLPNGQSMNLRELLNR